MSQRCINAFAFGNDVYPNGLEVDDDAPILKTHAEHFAEVERSVVGRAVEQAEARPGGLRAATKKSAKKAAPAPAPKAEEPKSSAPEPKSASSEEK